MVFCVLFCKKVHFIAFTPLYSPFLEPYGPVVVAMVNYTLVGCRELSFRPRHWNIPPTVALSILERDRAMAQWA